MKKHFFHSGKIFAVALLALLQFSVQGDTRKAPKGFKAIFNGQDLTGWVGRQRDLDPRKFNAMNKEDAAKKDAEWQADFKKHWSVENGELVNDGHGVYATSKDYGDFELLIDYKTVPKADSGIYLRGFPQVQIWDSTEEAKFKYGADKGSGALWNNAANTPGKDPLVKADKPFGEWNSFRILIVKDVVTIYLNGQLVVDNAVMANAWDPTKPILDEGPIQLQTHGGEIRWRNIFLREIPRQEAIKRLEKAGYKQKALTK